MDPLLQRPRGADVEPEDDVLPRRQLQLAARGAHLGHLAEHAALLQLAAATRCLQALLVLLYPSLPIHQVRSPPNRRAQPQHVLALDAVGRVVWRTPKRAPTRRLHRRRRRGRARGDLFGRRLGRRRRRRRRRRRPLGRGAHSVEEELEVLRPFEGYRGQPLAESGPGALQADGRALSVGAIRDRGQRRCVGRLRLAIVGVRNEPWHQLFAEDRHGAHGAAPWAARAGRAQRRLQLA
mmetsp:Transcript_122624/g.392510  ORF Transcript_122624/g.392510 Transcript_122624/m.392510 type:complete len:237 (-) Transcript_122624:24-734(-)